MRKDLNKLLCEHPRHGSRYYGYHGIRTREYDVSEDAPTRQKMKKPYGWETKTLSEYFPPLMGLLRRNVGRKWDDVYSELRANLRVDRAIDFHIMQHLWDFVERHTFMKDGKVYALASYGRPYEVNESGQMYIHPETGILCRCPEKKKARWTHKTPKGDLHIEIAENTHMIQKDGLWFVCEMAVPEKIKVHRWYDWKNSVMREQTRPGEGYDSLYKRWIQYPTRYVKSHRSASKKEIMKYAVKKGS